MRVNWISNFWAGNGYGTASYELAVGLGRLGVDVRTLRPAQTSPEMVRGLPSEAAEIFYRPFALGDVAVVMTVPYGLDAGRELPLPRVAYTMFETTRLPAQWLDYFQDLARVVVPTAVCYEAFRASGAPATDVVPLGVNPERYRHIAPPPVSDVEPFVFLVPWADWRKGANLAHLAFVREFAPDEPVRLLIKSHGQNGAFRSMDERVTFFNRWLSEGAMDALLATSHCGLIPSHGEAGPLDAIKLLAMGRPVILTGWSGRDDLHGAPGVYEVALDGFEKAAAYDRYFTELMGEPVDCGEWADLSLSSLQAQMRRAYREWRQWIPMTSRLVSDWARDMMSWERSAEKLLGVLERTIQSP